VDVLELVREEEIHPGVLPKPSSGAEMHGKKHNKNVHEVREPRPDPLRANNRRSQSGREGVILAKILTSECAVDRRERHSGPAVQLFFCSLFN
jgi:hypothetical protein